jgi:plastocyanin
MKKLYSLICATALTTYSFAATVSIAVGVNSGGTPANVFTPSSVTCNVGDQLSFILASGTHNVTSTSVPGGAAAMSSGTMSTPGQMYNYTVTVAGVYNYGCTFHAGMVGTATASAAAGIADPTVDLLTQAYPNPFNEKMTLKYNGIDKVEFFNVVGEKVASFKLTDADGKAEFDLSDLSAGVYFYRTYREGTIVETRKVVKK